MQVQTTPLPGVQLIEPRVFDDARGWFTEFWNGDRFAAAGLTFPCQQVNLSHSQPGVLRGLHFQEPEPQGKLVAALAGAVFDVAVDVRVGSPHFGRWWGTELSAANHRQLFIPEGFAHGFCVVSAQPALFAYLCTRPYAAAADRGLHCADPQLGIAWPLAEPILSDKDAAAPGLRDLEDAGLLPLYRP